MFKVSLELTNVGAPSMSETLTKAKMMHAVEQADIWEAQFLLCK